MMWEIVESFQPFFLSYLTEKQDQSLSDCIWSLICSCSFYWKVEHLKELTSSEEILKLCNQIYASFFEVGCDGEYLINRMLLVRLISPKYVLLDWVNILFGFVGFYRMRLWIWICIAIYKWDLMIGYDYISIVYITIWR